MEGFSVNLPEDPDNPVNINMGSNDVYTDDDTPKLLAKGRNVNLAVYGDSRFYGRLISIGDIFYNGKPIEDVIKAEVAEALKDKQNVGKMEVVSFKKKQA